MNWEGDLFEHLEGGTIKGIPKMREEGEVDTRTLGEGDKGVEGELDCVPDSLPAKTIEDVLREFRMKGKGNLKKGEGIKPPGNYFLLYRSDHEGCVYEY